MCFSSPFMVKQWLVFTREGVRTLQAWAVRCSSLKTQVKCVKHGCYCPLLSGKLPDFSNDGPPCVDYSKVGNQLGTILYNTRRAPFLFMQSYIRFVVTSAVIKHEQSLPVILRQPQPPKWLLATETHLTANMNHVATNEWHLKHTIATNK